MTDTEIKEIKDATKRLATLVLEGRIPAGDAREILRVYKALMKEANS